MVGLARPDIDVHKPNAFTRDKIWGLHLNTGSMFHAGGCKIWIGRQGFGKGDVVGLLLDCDAGTLTVKKNGKRLGVAATGLTGELCWAAALHHCVASSHIQIVAADAAADGW
jgi:hypothetical protein